MSSDLKIGVASESRPSSRVLKPPGGGHSNIFAEPEVSVNAPRPKYNQQNSSNLNACMGSVDPNKIVEKLREELTSPSKDEGNANANAASNGTNNADKPQSAGSKANGNDAAAQPQQRGRVPPGGFSSGGFW